MGETCAFCTFGVSPLYDRLDAGLVIEAFAQVLENEGSFDIALGGATPNVVDCGASYYADIVRGVKKRWDIPISVEIMPPREVSSLDILVDAGVDALIMNLELYDDRLRRRFCPGKSQASKERYYEAWEYATSLLGRGRVASVLIVGLESAESTLTGCQRMVETGVVPTLIPFRPYDTCALRNCRPISPDFYLSVARKCSEMVHNVGLDPRLQAGCTRCGGCSLDTDLVGGKSIIASSTRESPWLPVEGTQVASRRQ